MSAPTPKYFKAWIIFFLIATVGGFFLGAIIGGVLGGVMAVAGQSVATIKFVAGILGFVLGIPISYFTFRWTVSEFIVKPLTPPPPVTPPAQSVP